MMETCFKIVRQTQFLDWGIDYCIDESRKMTHTKIKHKLILTENKKEQELSQDSGKFQHLILLN